MYGLGGWVWVCWGVKGCGAVCGEEETRENAIESNPETHAHTPLPPTCIIHKNNMYTDARMISSFKTAAPTHLVDLVKEVEGRGVAALDGEDEGEGHEGLLPPRELLHQVAVPLPGEGHLGVWVAAVVGWVGV